MSIANDNAEVYQKPIFRTSVPMRAICKSNPINKLGKCGIDYFVSSIMQFK